MSHLCRNLDSLPILGGANVGRDNEAARPLVDACVENISSWNDKNTHDQWPQEQHRCNRQPSWLLIRWWQQTNKQKRKLFSPLGCCLLTRPSSAGLLSNHSDLGWPSPHKCPYWGFLQQFWLEFVVFSSTEVPHMSFFKVYYRWIIINALKSRIELSRVCRLLLNDSKLNYIGPPWSSLVVLSRH